MLDISSIPFLTTLELEHQRVFVRADLNVPLKDGVIIDATRLQAIVPTIRKIQQQGGKVVLATHIGRPPAHEQTNYFDASLSTHHLVPWFKDQGFSITFERDLKQAAFISQQDFSDILLLENLRFFNGEKINNHTFAHLLAHCADRYVNDAFGLIHRTDTSVTLLPQEFEPHHRAFGCLIEKEITALLPLTQTVEQPFHLILGGSKVPDKLEILKKIVCKSRDTRPQVVLLGGLLAFPFLKVLGRPTGGITVDENVTTLAHEILADMQAHGVEYLLPTDHVLEKSRHIRPGHELTQSDIPIDIGPATLRTFQEKLGDARTIFFNGTLGRYEQGGAQGTIEIVKFMADCSAHTVIGGGDTVAVAHSINIEKQLDYVSTGGGATLAFLSVENPLIDLPAVESIVEEKTCNQ